MENTPSSDEKTMAMLCHLLALAGYAVPIAGNIVGPLILWQIKREESAYIDHHGREAVNFQINVSIYLMIAIVLCFVFIGILLLPVICIGALVLMIVAAIKAKDGVEYRYPFIFRLV